MSVKDSDWGSKDSQMAELETLLQSQPDDGSNRAPGRSARKSSRREGSFAKRGGSSLPKIRKEDTYYSERTKKGESVKMYTNYGGQGSRASFDIKDTLASDRGEGVSGFGESSFGERGGNAETKAMALISRFDQKFGEKKGEHQVTSGSTYLRDEREESMNDEQSDEGGI